MRIKRRFEHMINRIEAESGLIDDCTHIVYLNSGYTHDVFGESYPVKNSIELKNYMEEVIPVNTNVIDIACLTQPIDFYNISKLGDVILTYYDSTQLCVCETTSTNLLNIFFNEPTLTTYKQLNLNNIITIANHEKTYIIHGYDIAWWRNNLKRLDNGLDKIEKKEKTKSVETITNKVPTQDVSNWFDFYKSKKLEEQVKYNIASVVEEYCNIHYDNGEYAEKETIDQLIDRVYNEVTVYYRDGEGRGFSDNRLRYFGKANIIELAKIYITNYSDVQSFIQRSDK